MPRRAPAAPTHLATAARPDRDLVHSSAATVDPVAVRAFRAVAVLEAGASADAKGLLAELAGGDPYAPLTREAATAAKRLGAK